MKKYILIISFLGLLTLLMLFCFTFFSIYSSVESICIQAKHEFNSDCVESLISYIKSESHTIREKNRAVWALGQFADKKALPFLEEIEKSAFSGKQCDLDKDICQYEVKKAIKWCTQGNSTSWMYRDL